MNIDFIQRRVASPLTALAVAVCALGAVAASVAPPATAAVAHLPQDPACVNTGEADVCDNDSVDDAPPPIAPEVPFGEGALGDLAAPGYNATPGGRDGGGHEGGHR